MHNELDEDIAKKLDALITKSLEGHDGVSCDQLLNIDFTHLDHLDSVLYLKKLKEYDYYLDILKEFDIVTIDKSLDNFHVRPIPVKTKRFKDSGGFLSIFNKQQFEIQRKLESEKLSFEKLKWDTQISKWQRKTFWYLFFAAIISFIYSTYSMISSITSIPEDQKIKTMIKNELQQIQEKETSLLKKNTQLFQTSKEISVSDSI